MNLYNFKKAELFNDDLYMGTWILLRTTNSSARFWDARGTSIPQVRNKVCTTAITIKTVPGRTASSWPVRTQVSTNRNMDSLVVATYGPITQAWTRLVRWSCVISNLWRRGRERYQITYREVWTQMINKKREEDISLLTKDLSEEAAKIHFRRS